MDQLGMNRRGTNLPGTDRLGTNRLGTNDVVIVDAVRSPTGRGKPGGALAHVHPTDLLAGVIEALVARTGIDPAVIGDVYAGCVSQVGEQSFNIARNAALGAGLAESVPGVTIDRQCGSSQQAVAFAVQAIAAGAEDVVVVCGVESMSRVPLRSSLLGADPYGARLAARYPAGLVHQGIAAELVAADHGIGRSELDAFAARSHTLAAAAWARGDFDSEVVRAVEVGAEPAIDETIRPSTTASALAALPPAFIDEAATARFPRIGWHITAGTSSPLSDGASAALVMSATRAHELGLTARARIVASVAVGSDPIRMLDGIIPATEAVLARAGLDLSAIDAVEINEAFASVPLAWCSRFADVPPERVNPRGGAIALGHALGSSGTRLLATLLTDLETDGGRYGLQTMCEGGGMANAMIVERLGAGA